jgi:pimeloyl-ACP methyl ester carboxylesterase
MSMNLRLCACSWPAAASGCSSTAAQRTGRRNQSGLGRRQATVDIDAEASIIGCATVVCAKLTLSKPSRRRAMEVVEVDGLQIAYERAGSGPALVLLHGYVGDGPTTWRRQLDGLSDEFTVIAWDAPGAGRSDDPPERFGLDGYADCLAGFLERLGLDTAHVAGLSLGGTLALALQRRHSAMSSALILASAYAGWAGSLPREVAEQRLGQALALAEGPPEAFAGALLPTMFSKAMPRETVDDFRASMEAFHPRGFRAMARASAEDVRDVLPHIDVPTLLLSGDRDVRAPLTVAEALHAAISGSRLVVLPDAGHLCNIEAPDEFNVAVRDFLHDIRS